MMITFFPFFFFFFPVYMLTLYPALPLARDAEFLSFVSMIIGPGWCVFSIAGEIGINAGTRRNSTPSFQGFTPSTCTEW